MSDRQNSDKSAPEKSWSRQLQTIIKRRRLSVIMIVGGFLLLLVLFNVANFFFLHQMRSQLESELDIRLRSVAILSANLVENFLRREQLASLEYGIESEVTLLIIQDRLNEIKRTHQLEGLFIIDENYDTLLDSYAELDLNVSRTYLVGDSINVGRAWAGVPGASPLHVLERQKFKSAYAPLRNLSGDVIGILVTEANAYFFHILERYRNTFLIAAMGSAGIFVLFAAFIIYALRLLIRTQETLSKSERLAMMGQMSAVLAHEIRNPLGIIRGTADVLKSRYENQQTPDPLFHYIPDEVNRLNKLVNDFLILSRDSQLSYEENDLNELINEIVQKAQLDDEKTPVRFQIEAGGIAPFKFDRNGIAQVLMNLVRNSMQATTSDGLIRIKARAIEKRRKSYVQIEIQDSGHGIDGDPRVIFEPFYTTKSTGSGLGMPVSKRIVETHGGKIEVESRPGVGTNVTIILPCKPNNEES
jgi:signal transduction histidine kinase